MEEQTKRKNIYPGEPGYKHSEASAKAAMQRMKRALMNNPEKHLSDLLPFLPKASCDRDEEYVRSKWDEIEIVP